MQDKKSLERDFEQLLALKGLTETYEDVAVSKMQTIRADVLATREFLSGIAEIYTLTKSAYLAQVSQITNRREREREIQFIHKNNKTIAVFISGNHSLLGSVIFQTYKVFLELCRKIECDKLILGDIGRYLASAQRPSLNFSYYPFEDFKLVEVQIAPVVNFINAYEKVIVVYPRFESVLIQVPQIDNISGGVTVEQSISGKKRYFFEPSAKEVMRYFENQVVGTLFRQKILESMLAKYASRLTIMDTAAQTIKKYIEENRNKNLIEARRMANKKLLSSFAGMSVWE